MDAFKKVEDHTSHLLFFGLLMMGFGATAWAEPVRHVLFDARVEIRLPSDFSVYNEDESFVSLANATVYDRLLAEGETELIAALKADDIMRIFGPVPETPESCEGMVDMVRHTLCGPAQIVLVEYFDLDRTIRFLDFRDNLSINLEAFEKYWLGANSEAIVRAFCEGAQWTPRRLIRFHDHTRYAEALCLETDPEFPQAAAARVLLTKDRLKSAATVVVMDNLAEARLWLKAVAPTQTGEAPSDDVVAARIEALTAHEAQLERATPYFDILDGLRFLEAAFP